VRYAIGATYTSQSPAVLPTSVLTPPSGSGHGVLAEYFDNADFCGQPKSSGVEPRPLVQMPTAGAAVRWTGTLRPAVSGDYTLGGSRIFLDDKELTDPHVKLEAGHAYRLRAEYRQRPEVSGQVTWIPPAAPLLAEAVEAVKNADVAIAFVGLNPNLEGEEMRVSIPGFKGGDRTDLKLPQEQEKLLEAAMATGKPVVVVLTSGSALAVNNAAERAAAVLELWYGGEEAGTAIAETLAGINNPAGRLPVTFYRDIAQLPPFEDYSMNGRTYRYFKGDSLYGFGFGMSYSKFQYSALKSQRSEKGGRVSVRVKNDSNREGDEVVQLYSIGSGADDAIRQLRGFQRIHLGAGETRDVQFALDELPAGKVKIGIGGSQRAALEGSI